jgi:hypothetical protein
MSDVETRLVAIAQQASMADIRDYEPTETAQKLAAAFFHETAPSLNRLAESAGVSRSTLYRVLSEPAAVHWIINHGTHMAQAALGAVHARLFELAMTSQKIAPLRLYLERFDPDFKKQKALTDGHNTQINFVTEMSDDELRRMVEQKTTRLLGSAPRGSDSHPSNRLDVTEVQRPPEPNAGTPRVPDRDEEPGWRRVASAGVPRPPCPSEGREEPDPADSDAGGAE